MVFVPYLCEDKSSLNKSSENQKQRMKRRLNCELLLDDDGTFVLNPPSDLGNNESRSEVSETSYLPLRGHWMLKANPYCVTDRHYDELTLVSDSKVRYGGDERNKEKITMELHCKVWGRFSSNSIRYLLKHARGKDAGRLTHGTLSIRKEMFNDKLDNDSSSPILKSARVVCATFNAKSLPKR